MGQSGGEGWLRGLGGRMGQLSVGQKGGEGEVTAAGEGEGTGGRGRRALTGGGGFLCAFLCGFFRGLEASLGLRSEEAEAEGDEAGGGNLLCAFFCGT